MSDNSYNLRYFGCLSSILNGSITETFANELGILPGRTSANSLVKQKIVSLIFDLLLQHNSECLQKLVGNSLLRIFVLFKAITEDQLKLWTERDVFFSFPCRHLAVNCDCNIFSGDMQVLCSSLLKNSSFEITLITLLCFYFIANYDTKYTSQYTIFLTYIQYVPSLWNVGNTQSLCG